MALVGLVGWRGMVGSVLMERMQAEGDFALIEPAFFSTSNAGGQAPSMAKNETRLLDAHDIAIALDKHANIAIRSGNHCVHSWLRAHGLKGTARASFYLYNTAAEADLFAAEVQRLAA